MRKPLFIYGAGGLGREVLSLLKVLEDWEPVGFIDDGLSKGTMIKGVKVFGGAEVFQSGIGDPIYVVLAIGSPQIKAKLAQTINYPHVQHPVLIHPSAIVQDSESVRIGAGSILTAGCRLTTDIQIGMHVLVNLNATIGHDAHIGDYTSIMPGVNIGGEVTIGQTVLVGSGASILNRMQIGDRSTVGMGSVVIQDVPSDVTVVGVPAKCVKR